MSPSTDPIQDKQRAGIRRTAWILAACAVAAYALFLWTSMRGHG